MGEYLRGEEEGFTHHVPHLTSHSLSFTLTLTLTLSHNDKKQESMYSKYAHTRIACSIVSIQFIDTFRVRVSHLSMGILPISWPSRPVISLYMRFHVINEWNLIGLDAEA